MKLGCGITLAAGPNAPVAILVRLRNRLAPELWSHVGYLSAEAAEQCTPLVDEDGNPVLRAAADRPAPEWL